MNLKPLLRKLKIMQQPKLLDAAFVENACDSYSHEALREICRALGFCEREAYRAFLTTVSQEAWENYFLTLNTSHDPASGRPRQALPMPMAIEGLESIARQAHRQGKRPEQIFAAFWEDAGRRCGCTATERDWILKGLRRIANGSATSLGNPPGPPEPVGDIAAQVEEASQQQARSRQATENAHAKFFRRQPQQVG